VRNLTILLTILLIRLRKTFGNKKSLLLNGQIIVYFNTQHREGRLGCVVTWSQVDKLEKICGNDINIIHSRHLFKLTGEVACDNNIVDFITKKTDFQ